MGDFINSTDLYKDIIWNNNANLSLIINSTNCPVNLKANLKIDYDVLFGYISE